MAVACRNVLHALHTALFTSLRRDITPCWRNLQPGESLLRALCRANHYAVFGSAMTRARHHADPIQQSGSTHEPPCPLRIAHYYSQQHMPEFHCARPSFSASHPVACAADNILLHTGRFNLRK